MPSWTRFSALMAGLLVAGSASAATCRDPAGFEKWLGDIEQEAIQQGIAPQAVRTVCSTSRTTARTTGRTGAGSCRP